MHPAMFSPRRRSRPFYAGLVLVTIASGLASREFPQVLPDQLGKYPGDALWALMLFLLVGFARPRWSTSSAAATALVVSFTVEFSQLYQAAWMVALRQTTLGHLVLGSTFHAPDLLAYAVGIAVAAGFEMLSSMYRTSL